MKKIHLFLFSILILSISCSKDDDIQEKPKKTPVEIQTPLLKSYSAIITNMSLIFNYLPDSFNGTNTPRTEEEVKVLRDEYFENHLVTLEYDNKNRIIKKQGVLNDLRDFNGGVYYSNNIYDSLVYIGNKLTVYNKATDGTTFENDIKFKVTFDDLGRIIEKVVPINTNKNYSKDTPEILKKKAIINTYEYNSNNELISSLSKFKDNIDPFNIKSVYRYDNGNLIERISTESRYTIKDYDDKNIPIYDLDIPKSKTISTVKYSKYDSEPNYWKKLIVYDNVLDFAVSKNNAHYYETSHENFYNESGKLVKSSLPTGSSMIGFYWNLEKNDNSLKLIYKLDQ